MEREDFATVSPDVRQTVMAQIRRERVIAIVRGVGGDACLRVAEALHEGGIRLLEVTYDQKNPGSWEETAKTIGRMSAAFAGSLSVGAGTVTSVALADLTADHGGLFAISPNTNPAVIRRTRERGLVSIPGAMTATEILTAHEAGADFVKVFPVGEFGPGYLKALCAPLSHIPMIAVGGVHAQNALDFYKAGAVAVGVGGNLANRTWIAQGEFGKITEAARELVGVFANV